MPAVATDANSYRAQTSDARAALASIAKTREQLTATTKGLDKSINSAEQTLKEINETLAKWDRMKATFGEVRAPG